MVVRCYIGWMNKPAIIYGLTHKGGDSYVGCTTNKGDRWRRHTYKLRAGQHHSRRLQALWDGDGEAAFEFEVFEVVTDPSKAVRVSRELHWIASRGTLNTLISGDGRFTLRTEDSDQQRMIALATMAADPDLAQFLTQRGKELAELARSPESRAAMSHHSKRRWKDPEEAKKLRSGLERRWQDPNERKRMSERMKSSEENAPIREKRAKTLAATWADPERNAKLMESRANRWADPEARERHTAKMRAIWAARRNPA